jgi:hypothetical protein
VLFAFAERVNLRDENSNFIDGGFTLTELIIKYLVEVRFVRSVLHRIGTKVPAVNTETWKEIAVRHFFSTVAISIIYHIFISINISFAFLVAGVVF